MVGCLVTTTGATGEADVRDMNWLDAHPLGVIRLDEHQADSDGTEGSASASAPGFVVGYANHAATKLWALPVDLLLGRALPPLHFLDESGQATPGELDPIRRVCEGSPSAGRRMALARDGSAYWYQVVASASSAGSRRVVTVTFTDVTSEVERAKQELRRAESIMEAMGEGVTLHGPDGAVQYSNRAAVQILGRTSAELLGKTPLDPDWRILDQDGNPLEPTALPSHRSRITGETFHNIIMGLPRPDQRHVWLRVSTYPFRCAEGAPHCVVTTFSDVTAELQAARELSESQERYRALLKAVPGVVYRYEILRDGSEHFDIMSDACEEVMGVPAQAVLERGSRIWTHIHEDDRAEVAARAQYSLENLEPWEAEFRIWSPDRSSFHWVKGRSIPERTERGTRWAGVAVDVTETKQLERLLQTSQRREAMVSLASGIAHNFNNVLGVIVPSLQYAMGRARGKDAESLSDALQAADGAAELIQQLLSLARDDPPEPEESPQDLVPAIQRAVNLCRSTFGRHIAVRAQLASGPLPARLSEHGVHQLVFNLCNNARDALDGREAPAIDLKLTAVRGPVPGGSASARRHVLLEVTDNGCGMSTAMLERLGEPFVTSKPRSRGTGLGLTTVYHLVRDAGGIVHCESEEGRGTHFAIRLPLCEGEPAVPEHRSTSQIPGPSQGTLVLIEDEALVRRALIRAIESLELQVVQVERGDEALPTLRRLANDPEHDVRAVVLDLGLPGLSGEQVLPLINQEFEHLPVVVLSGHVVRRFLPGAAAVLSKPIRAEELCEQLERVCARPPPSTPSTPSG